MTNKVKPPLVFCLIEVKFHNILKIDDLASQIQDLYRKDYQSYQFAPFVDVQLTGTDFQTNQRKQHYFKSNDERSTIAISTDSFSLTTSHYSGSESFLNECISLIDSLASLVGDINITRIGMRYGDAIFLDSPDQTKEYLPSNYDINPNLLSLPDTYPFSHKTEMFMKSPSGTLAIRTLLANTNIIHMPEARLPIKFSPDFIKEPGFRILIDTDHFTEYQESIPYEHKGFSQTVKDLHKITSQAFREVTLERARKQWGLS